jgi:DNA-binding NtrC family response regulator
MLRAYKWPGNVRELRNVVERLLLLQPEDAPLSIEPAALAAILPSKVNPPGSQPEATPRSVDDVEKAHILRILSEHGGNKTRAARTLGIDFKTLLNKLRKYGIA